MTEARMTISGCISLRSVRPSGSRPVTERLPSWVLISNYSDLTSYNLVITITNCSRRMTRSTGQMPGDPTPSQRMMMLREETGYAKSVIWYARTTTWSCVPRIRFTRALTSSSFNSRISNKSKVFGSLLRSKLDASARRSCTRPSCVSKTSRLNQNLEDSLFSQRRLEQGL